MRGKMASGIQQKKREELASVQTAWNTMRTYFPVKNITLPANLKQDPRCQQ
jgi:hypothetical protein